jgi:hypothetical protein
MEAIALFALHAITGGFGVTVRLLPETIFTVSLLLCYSWSMEQAFGLLRLLCYRRVERI